MADNVQTNSPSSAGAIFATEEVSGIHHQKVVFEKLVEGIPRAIDADNPMPVSLPSGLALAANQQMDGLTNNELRAAPIPISGTVTVNTSALATSVKQDAEIAALADIIAKIIPAPATEAKQDTGNTVLSSILAKDFATQTTLAALLAKIIAAPATEALQTALNALVTTSNASLAAISTNTNSPIQARAISRFYNIRGQRYIGTTGYVVQTANTAGELIAMFRNPSGSGQYVLFDKVEFGATVNSRFSRYGGGTIALNGTPTRRPIGRTDGGTSTSLMEIYTAGKTSPQFSVSVEGTLRKVAVMQGYQQYQLNEMDGTVVLAPGQTSYWRSDEPLGGGGTDYFTLINYEWVEMPTANWLAMVAALQAKSEY